MPISRASAALLLPVLLVVGGCRSSSHSDGAGAGGGERVHGSAVTDTDDPKISDAQDSVARRPRATPQEIFDVGVPQSLDVRPDGSLITSWLASADTGGEGPAQRAWRAFDAEGHRIAQGRMSETGDVLAVGDGFLVSSGSVPLGHVLHVGPGGALSRVSVSDRRGFPRRGDTLVPGLASYYRPSSGTLLVSSVAPEVPAVGVAGGGTAAVSDTGVLYEYADPPRSPLPLGVTSDGGRSWRYTRLAVGALRPSLVAAHGRDAVIVLTRRGSSSLVAGLSVTADAGRTWQRAGPPVGLPADAYVDRLTLGADGRALIGGYGTGWWRARPADPSSYSRLLLPRDGVSDVRAAKGRLFAMSSTGIWSSTDGGTLWTRFDARD